MPTADRNDSSTLADSDRERDRERGGDLDRGEKGKSKSASSKAKDLSHVPCKFFKVGSCTAGPSCPFSHSMVEPGGQKDVCAWFVKGNCKFGHKCALAHVLPGQSMAMDRKNKKAAQAAAGGVGGASTKDGQPKGRGGKRDPQGAAAPSRNPLLTGSTAPMRPGRPPMTMPLKATISPSAPAPPLKDTDFASFGVLDEDSQLPSAPAQGKTSPQAGSETSPGATAPHSNPTTDEKPAGPSIVPAKSPPSPVTLPVSTPSAPRRLPNSTHATTPSLDFGPIGSPPRSSASTHTNSLSRVNGFSPGTSPSRDAQAGGNYMSSSPFSAPGTQSVFLSYGDAPQIGGGMRGGLAASLGSGMAMKGRPWNTELGPVPSQVSGRTASGGARVGGDYDIGFEYEEYGKRPSGLAAARGMRDIAVEDEDLEDFLPSSLTDLLTPEERSRRMSRSNSGQGAGAVGSMHGEQQREGMGMGSSGGLGVGLGGGGGSGHRYSRSVPAPSLLGDIKSIWADNTNSNTNTTSSINAGLPSSPTRPGLGSGTPSSYKSPSQTGFGGRAFDSLGDELGHHSPSSSLLSPSNASAAFLPGLHHHYLNAKAKQSNSGMGMSGSGVGRGMRNTSNPLYPTTSHNNPLGLGATNNGGGNYLQTSSSTLSGSPSHLHTFARPSPFDLSSNSNNGSNPTSDAYLRGVRPIPNQNPNPNNNEGEMHMLSPSARALQAHAPGQSLPQGLAAGYSRIHALPPLPMASPGSATGIGVSVSPGVGGFGGGSNGGNEWGGPGTGISPTSGNVNNNGNNGLDSMLSRLSYSAAAASRGSPAASGAPPGMVRNVSGGSGKHWQGQGGPLSPLSGPVVTGDDDDLFSMDG